jgi:hypothetical protein
VPGLPPVPIYRGRPDLEGLLDDLGREAGRRNRPGRGVAVVACGPGTLVSSVGREVDRAGFHWRKLNYYI